jgi:hypothetical protein
LVRHEFVTTVKLVPDATFLRMLATNGPNFLVQLDGCLSGQNVVYYVRKASVVVTASDENEASLTCELVLVNSKPLQGSGNYDP